MRVSDCLSVCNRGDVIPGRRIVADVALLLHLGMVVRLPSGDHVVVAFRTRPDDMIVVDLRRSEAGGKMTTRTDIVGIDVSVGFADLRDVVMATDTVVHDITVIESCIDERHGRMTYTAFIISRNMVIGLTYGSDAIVTLRTGSKKMVMIDLSGRRKGECDMTCFAGVVRRNVRRRLADLRYIVMTTDAIVHDIGVTETQRTHKGGCSMADITLFRGLNMVGCLA